MAWDPVIDPSLVGYMVYSGPSAGNYITRIDVGNTTTYTASNLVEGATYHFAATAYDVSHTESGFSNDVSATVPYSAPVAQFSPSTTSGTAPLALNFTSTSTGTISTYAWTFGDATTSSAQNPSHVYAAAGVYTVSLTVTGPGGSNTQTRSNYITVSAPAVGVTTTMLSSNLNPSGFGISVTFTATVVGTAPTGSVNFTDGGNSIDGCAASALSGSADVRTAICSTNSLSIGSHSIVATYGGDAGNTGSSSAPFSQVVNPGSSSSLLNGDFEIPALGNSYQYSPSASGIGWTFSAGSGIEGNGSAWDAAPASDGTQAAFIQGTGSIAQTLNLTAGSYALSFRAAQRSCCSSPYVQPIKVSVDGVQIGGLILPQSTSFAAFSISFAVSTTGPHTIMFEGTDPDDKTTFVDTVELAAPG